MAIQPGSHGAAQQGPFTCPAGSVFLVCFFLFVGCNEANANKSAAAFSAIHRHVPTIDSVLIIYHRNGALPEKITAALSEGEKYSIKVRLQPVESLLEYAQHYREAVNSSPTNQAILITQSLPKPLLFNVLQTAWDRKLVLVSTIQEYARYGVLLTVTETEVILNPRMAKRLDAH